MRLIWKTSFWCEACGKDAEGSVYRQESSESLPEEEKKKALELMQYYHRIDNHITCWKCGKHIKPQELGGMVYVNDALKDLCRKCAKTSK